MKKTRHTTDQIIEKLRHADVALVGQGAEGAGGLQGTPDHGADLLPLASEVWRDGP